MNRRRIAVLVIGAVGALLLAGCDGHHDARPAPTLHVTVTHTVTPSATQPPQPSRPRTASRTVTVIGSGDVLIHPPVWEQAATDARVEGRTGYDFGPIFASVAPRTRAVDVAICELETPLASPGGPFQGYPTFSAPPQVLTALRGAGYDSCTTASNHTIDQGFDGLKRTLDELDAAGLKHTGSARTPAEAARPLIIRMANGARVAQLAYSFGFNGLARPAGQEWPSRQGPAPLPGSAQAPRHAAWWSILAAGMCRFPRTGQPWPRPTRTIAPRRDGPGTVLPGQPRFHRFAGNTACACYWARRGRAG